MRKYLIILTAGVALAAPVFASASALYEQLTDNGSSPYGVSIFNNPVIASTFLAADTGFITSIQLYVRNANCSRPIRAKVLTVSPEGVSGIPDTVIATSSDAPGGGSFFGFVPVTWHFDGTVSLEQNRFYAAQFESESFDANCFADFLGDGNVTGSRIYRKSGDNWQFITDNDFRMTVAGSKSAIHDLKQMESDAATVILEGGATFENHVTFQALVTNAFSNSVKLQVELRQITEPFTGSFDGGIFQSDLVPSGSVATLSRGSLVDAPYHWRARAIDAGGNASDWREFGREGNVDFFVDAVKEFGADVFYSQPNDNGSVPYNEFGTGNMVIAETFSARNTGFVTAATLYVKYQNCRRPIQAKIFTVSPDEFDGTPGTLIATSVDAPADNDFNLGRGSFFDFYPITWHFDGTALLEENRVYALELEWSSSDPGFNCFAYFLGDGNVTNSKLYRKPGDTWQFITDNDLKMTVKGTPSRDPVVIVPGLFGSEEKNGELILQPRLKPYDSLKATLVANGYVKDETLFDFPYNWRKSNVVTAALLKEKIQEIRDICQCGKVDVVAHSMGGLVARQYIQSDSYQDDVDQLIFLGTPHVGAPKAYSAWEGGLTEPRFKLFDFLFRRTLTQEALEAGFTRFANFDRILFDYIHATSSPIVSIQELLPIYNYLRDFDTNNLRDYPNGYPLNVFLEELNATTTLAALEQSDVRMSNIFSDSQEDTINFIQVKNDTSTLPLWEHGIPKNFEFGVGDGTVPPVSSSDLIATGIENINVVGEHVDLPTSAQGKVFEILTGGTPTTVITIPPIKRFLSIFGFSPIDFLITAPDGKQIGKDFATEQEVNEIEGAFYTGFDMVNENIFIPDPLDGEYLITTHGTGDGSYELLIDYVREEGEGEATSALVSFTANTAPGLEERLRFNFSAAAPETVVIIPEDTTPPVITHTSIPSEILLNSTSTIFNFAASDDTTGVLNLFATFDGQPLSGGDFIHFTIPGAHVIEIRAEDFIGNIATTRINFNVIYQFGGFLPPVKGGNVYKAGRTLPVKFQLTDANNQFVSAAVARLFVAEVRENVVGADEVPLSASAADTSNFFRYDSENHQYIYNLSAKSLTAGTWQLKSVLNDGKIHIVPISIK